MSHSLISGGASIPVAFAFIMNGSLMMFTTKPLVTLIFLAVSLTGFASEPRVTEIEMTGGFVETWKD
jgi:hypothetical protein